jgi:uncharacterized repeat protein (TIGR01451 family)
MARPPSRSVVRGVGALLTVALLSLAATVPAQAATTSAAGAFSATISGPDSLTLGAPAPISIVVTNSMATAAAGTLGFSATIGTRVSAVNATGGLCTNIGGGPGGALLFCEIQSLAPGASATVTFSATASQLGTVDIGGATSPSGGAGVFDTAFDLSLPVTPAPTDVQVTGFASTGSPKLGSVYSYTFQVKNNGPFVAPSVTFVDTLPASLSFVGVTSNGGACSQAAGTVNCAFGDMAVGSQAKVVISVQAPGTAQTIADGASVSEAVTDRNPANNTVSVTVQAK